MWPKTPRKKKKSIPAKQVTAARAATKLSASLLTKREIVALSGFTYPWIWQMMRAGKFPRGRIVGGKTMWLTSEVDAWLAKLPVRPLKGDADRAAASGAQQLTA
jgi:predicted DNA-binding transcriptional regulator AlpA